MVKNTLLSSVGLLLFAGCAVSSDPGRVYAPQTVLTFQELPTPVQDSINKEQFNSAILRITEFGKPEHCYYLLFCSGWKRCHAKTRRRREEKEEVGVQALACFSVFCSDWSVDLLDGTDYPYNSDGTVTCGGIL